MISDVDIRDWQKSEEEVNGSTPACGWLLVAAPFLLAATTNEYMWSRYSMYARAIGEQSIGSQGTQQNAPVTGK
jgi:hypothetical protein